VIGGKVQKGKGRMFFFEQKLYQPTILCLYFFFVTETPKPPPEIFIGNCPRLYIKSTPADLWATQI